MADEARAHARVTGYVQGVGFRWFTLRLAQQYGLTGWVRNRPDGSVELEAEGEREVVETFLGEVRSGPRFGRIASVSVDWVPLRHDSSFEVTG
jgi:acylphosphatase